MKLNLVATIKHLTQNTLASDEFIVIDLWGDEGYELQKLTREYEGQTELRDKGFLRSSDNPCKNSQLNCLMEEIGKADLAIQFIDSYPAQHRDDNELNLRVVIMRRETLQDALRRFDPCQPTRNARKASLQRSATGKRPALSRRQTQISATN